jgi:hypothetical protein
LWVGGVVLYKLLGGGGGGRKGADRYRGTEAER